MGRSRPRSWRDLGPACGYRYGYRGFRLVPTVPRGNAVLAALRPLRSDHHPTEEDAERRGRHSHGGPWERGASRMSKIEIAPCLGPGMFFSAGEMLNFCRIDRVLRESVAC